MNRRIEAALTYGVAVAALSLVLPPLVYAQGKVAEATAAAITTPSGRTTFVRAVLGSAEMIETSAESVKDARLVAGLATAVTTGPAGLPGSTSVATLSNVSLLSGLVTARNIVAIATAHASGASAAGSGFEGLAIRGIVLPAGDQVAPNTRVTLPGVGHVVLNEQVQEGDVLRVSMIRLVVDGTALSPKREIVVASATAGR